MNNLPDDKKLGDRVELRLGDSPQAKPDMSTISTAENLPTMEIDRQHSVHGNSSCSAEEDEELAYRKKRRKPKAQLVVDAAMLLIFSFGMFEGWLTQVVVLGTILESKICQPYDSYRLWRELGDQGAIYYKNRKYDAGLVYFRAALDEATKTGRPNWRSCLSLGGLGSIYADKGDLQRGEVCLKQELQTLETIEGPRCYANVETLFMLADISARNADHTKAESYLKRALDITNKSGPFGHHVGSSGVLHGLADLYNKQGNPSLGTKYRQAGDLAQRLSFEENKQFPDGRWSDPENPYCKSESAAAAGQGELWGRAFYEWRDYWHKENYEKAEELFKEEIEIRTRTLGPRHPYTAEMMNEYACFLRGRGRLTEAQNLEKEVDSIYDQQRARLHIEKFR